MLITGNQFKESILICFGNIIPNGCNTQHDIIGGFEIVSIRHNIKAAGAVNIGDSFDLLP